MRHKGLKFGLTSMLLLVIGLASGCAPLDELPSPPGAGTRQQGG